MINNISNLNINHANNITSTADLICDESENSFSNIDASTEINTTDEMTPLIIDQQQQQRRKFQKTVTPQLISKVKKLQRLNDKKRLRKLRIEQRISESKATNVSNGINENEIEYDEDDELENELDLENYHNDNELNRYNLDDFNQLPTLYEQKIHGIVNNLLDDFKQKQQQITESNSNYLN